MVAKNAMGIPTEWESITSNGLIRSTLQGIFFGMGFKPPKIWDFHGIFMEYLWDMMGYSEGISHWEYVLQSA